MRVLALTAPAVHLVLVGLAAYTLYFVATFRFENQSADDQVSDPWIVTGVVGMAALGIAYTVAIVIRRPFWGVTTLLVEAIVGWFVVSYALRQSDHSDVQLIVYTLAVGLAAAVAIVAMMSDGRARRHAVPAA